jgi:catechol 2,3-dioxygenase-like lactoylglutathione lyase family enzyme
MKPRLTVVTLGVRDIVRSRRFYEHGLGFVPSASSNEHISFYDAGGVVLALYGRRALAHDAGVDAAGRGFAGFTLAHNVGSREAVDEAFARAVAAGARTLKAPAEAFWGGYSGYFADPDGNAWEVAHNPFWSLDERGRVELPEP